MSRKLGIIKMLDTHEKIIGIMPYIFGIPSYSFFVGLGIIIGITYYLLDAKRRNVKNEGVIIIVASAIIFGTIGSKIPLIFESTDIAKWVFGKSIVGGLIGGMFGVVFVKRLLKIKLKLGNVIAPAVALGLIVGRLVCFFNGCCYGKISSWGFDFGDGNLRLPTQLFEASFNFIAFFILHYYKNKVKTPGILFKLYLFSYFIFRFIIEFIRENPIIWLGMSIYQIICFTGILYFGLLLTKGREKHE